MRIPVLLVAATLASLSLAQSPIVIPAGLTATEGASSTAYPWGRGVSQIRVQYIYDSTNITSQTASGAIMISALRWRANGAAIGVGSSYNNVTIQMATCPVDQAVASTTFAANLGPDVTTVYSGPVTVAAGAGTTPNNWYVSVPLTTPFLYIPSNGDLTFDIATDATGWVGAIGAADDCATTGSLTSRVYNLTTYNAPTGSFQANVGITTELTFTSVTGAASASSYGTGCYDAARSFYELFATAPAFDLANSGMSLAFNGTGYTVLPVFTTYVAPSGAATVVANGDDIEQIVTLGSALNYPGGSTTSLAVCSNGFVSAATGNGTSFSPAVAGFLAFAQNCWAAGWHDFNPTIVGSGSIKFEEVGSVSYVTWDGVWDFGGTTAANASSIQYQFDRSNGNVHILWGTMSTLGSSFLVGYKAAGTALDPGTRDVSATLPGGFVAGRDLRSLLLTSAPRPILGNTVVLTSSRAPANAGFGMTILSFTQQNPGLDLTGLGMPGCRQYVGLDSVQVFFPVGGTGSNSFFIPNNPAYSGAHVYAQSVAFAGGLNALGVISSNGIDLLTGTL